MNILFQSKSDLYNPKGGDTIQMEKLAEEIKKLGHSVDINLSINADLSNYDLVNIFNINHIVEFYPQFKNAKRQNKKVVISAIYHSMRDIERWEKLNSYGYRKVLNYLGITEDFFWEVMNLYREHSHVWEKVGSQWLLKHAVWNEKMEDEGYSRIKVGYLEGMR